MPSKKEKTTVPPGLPWDGPFPYLLLARFGITPGSTAAQVLDASFDMADALADPKINDAWESLRLCRNRLFLDFFCSELPHDAATAGPPDGGPVRPLPRSFLETLAQWVPDASDAPTGRDPAPLGPPDTLRPEQPFWESGITNQPDEETDP